MQLLEPFLFWELYDDLAWWTNQPTHASLPPTCSVHNAEEIPSGNFAGQSVFELCFMCLSTLKSSAWPISVRERLGLLLVALTSSQQHRRRRRRALNYALLLFRCKCPDLWANTATRLLRVRLSEPTPCRLIAPCFGLPHLVLLTRPPGSVPRSLNRFAAVFPEPPTPNSPHPF